MDSKVTIVCDICDGVIDDDYDVECPHCGALYCDSCNCFVSPDEMMDDMCWDCAKDREICRREAMYEMD